MRLIHSPVSSAIEAGFVEVKSIDLKTYKRDDDTVFLSLDDDRPDDDTPIVKRRGRRPVITSVE